MRIFKLKKFDKFARDEHITDESLAEAITRAESGLIDADLGGGLIKQRVARQGRGRSGGYRMIVGYRVGNRAVFLYGFPKNERDNIADDELKSWQDIGASWLNASDEDIGSNLETGKIVEVKL